jgi:hypothetical protein
MLQAARDKYVPVVREDDTDDELECSSISGRLDDSGTWYDVSYRPVEVIGETYKVDMIDDGCMVISSTRDLTKYASLSDAREFIESGGKRIAGAGCWKVPERRRTVDELLSKVKEEYDRYELQHGRDAEPFGMLSGSLDGSGRRFHIIYRPADVASGVSETYEVHISKDYAGLSRLVREYRSPGLWGKLLGHKPVLTKNPGLSEARTFINSHLKKK